MKNTVRYTAARQALQAHQPLLTAQVQDFVINSSFTAVEFTAGDGTLTLTFHRREKTFSFLLSLVNTWYAAGFLTSCCGAWTSSENHCCYSCKQPAQEQPQQALALRQGAAGLDANAETFEQQWAFAGAPLEAVLIAQELRTVDALLQEFWLRYLVALKACEVEELAKNA